MKTATDSPPRGRRRRCGSRRDSTGRASNRLWSRPPWSKPLNAPQRPRTDRRAPGIRAPGTRGRPALRRGRRSRRCFRRGTRRGETRRHGTRRHGIPAAETTEPFANAIDEPWISPPRGGGGRAAADRAGQPHAGRRDAGRRPSWPCGTTERRGRAAAHRASPVGRADAARTSSGRSWRQPWSAAADARGVRADRPVAQGATSVVQPSSTRSSWCRDRDRVPEPRDHHRAVETARSGVIPSLCIFERSVVRLSPRRTAAPRGPATIPFVSRSTSTMCSRRKSL